MNFGLTIDFGGSGVLWYKMLLDGRVNGGGFNSIRNS